MAIVSGLKGVCLLLSIVALLGISNAQSAYVGCYEDTQQRTTDSTSYANKPTPDDCREYCRSLSGTFAELLAGDQCRCTEWPTSDKQGRLDDSKCNVSCSGDPSKFCGGGPNSNAYSVYSSCPKGKFGIKNCTQNCNCKDNEQCQIVTGVCPEKKCAPGWKLNNTIPNRETCSIDVDECEFECTPSKATDCHNCKSADGEICNNTEGSYHCSCRNGFSNETGTCTAVHDVNRNIIIIVSVIVAILGLGLIVAIIYICLKKRKRKLRGNPSPQSMKFRKGQESETEDFNVEN